MPCHEKTLAIENAALDCLQWLVDDGVRRRINVTPNQQPIGAVFVTVPKYTVWVIARVIRSSGKSAKWRNG